MKYPRLELKYVRIDKLRPHEDVMPEVVDQLVDDIRSKGLRYPIIIDRDTYTIIDGHHRVEAFRKLGLSKIPAILVDYRSELVSVNRWFYILDYESTGWKLWSREVDETLLTFTKRVIKRLRPGEYEAILKHWRYITRFYHDNLREFYWIIHEATQGLPFRKIPEDQYRSEIPVIVPPPLYKANILAAALQGEKFPPKTTRHIFYFPIPEINYRV